MLGLRTISGVQHHGVQFVPELQNWGSRGFSGGTESILKACAVEWARVKLPHDFENAPARF